MNANRHSAANISPDAATARESARRQDGKFGVQEHAEPSNGLGALNGAPEKPDDEIDVQDFYAKAYEELDGPPLYDPLLDPDSEVSDDFWQRPDRQAAERARCTEPCCDHKGMDAGNCWDCYNTGHLHPLDEDEDRDAEHPEVDEDAEREVFDHHFTELRLLGYSQEDAQRLARAACEEEFARNTSEPTQDDQHEDPWLNIETALTPPF